MDASSIITQVSREDEQLNSYPPEKGKGKHDKHTVSILLICVLVVTVQIVHLFAKK